MLLRKSLLFFVLVLLISLFVISTPINNIKALTFDENTLTAELEEPNIISTRETGAKDQNVIFNVILPDEIKGAKLQGIINIVHGKNSSAEPSRAIIQISVENITLPGQKAAAIFDGWITSINSSQKDDFKNIIVNTSGNKVTTKPSLLKPHQETEKKPKFVSLYSNQNFTIKQRTQFDFEVLNIQQYIRQTTKKLNH